MATPTKFNKLYFGYQIVDDQKYIEKLRTPKRNSLFSDLHKLNKISVILSISVRDNIISQSFKVKDLGVTFGQLISFDD